MCPKCRSSRLRIKQCAGLERLLIYFSGKRKYRCRDCGNLFRAVDRRMAPRAAEPEKTEASAIAAQ